VNESTEVRIRAVEFRSGTEAELTALHTVEVPVAAERGSSRMPEPVVAYIAFAQNLPSQFDDHAWLAEAPDGTPVAAGFCWSDAAGDPRVMECDLFVRRDRRREGIGSRLFDMICQEAGSEGRSLLLWSTFDAVPAGEAFSRQVGGRVARVNRTSELRLADVDWPMVEEWAQAGRAREHGYRLEMIDGAFPQHLRADAATFHHIMQTAPRDRLDMADVLLEADHIAELDQALLAAGRMRWTALVRDATGACVGGTEVTFESQRSTVVLQQNTGIDPAHRGLGLAKWAKGAMLERLRRERPEAETVRTANAFSNAPIVAINETLGFTVIGTRTEWQVSVMELGESSDH
jgi:mycothiol synthase